MICKDGNENKRICIFFKDEGIYAKLSNFYHHEMTIDGIKWPTVEHYYQASKYCETKVNKEYAEIIRNINTPYKAFLLGGKRIQHRFPWLALAKSN